MKALKFILVFLLGVVAGVVGLFFVLAFSDESQDVKVQPATTVVSTTSKQEACLVGAANQAREIYNEMAVRRGNIGVRMEFQRISQKELDKEDRISHELYAIAGAFIEPCVMYEEPVKLDRNILADIR